MDGTTDKTKKHIIQKAKKKEGHKIELRKNWENQEYSRNRYHSDDNKEKAKVKHEKKKKKRKKCQEYLQNRYRNLSEENKSKMKHWQGLYLNLSKK